MFLFINELNYDTVDKKARIQMQVCMATKPEMKQSLIQRFKTQTKSINQTIPVLMYAFRKTEYTYSHSEK